MLETVEDEEEHNELSILKYLIMVWQLKQEANNAKEKYDAESITREILEKLLEDSNDDHI